MKKSTYKKLIDTLIRDQDRQERVRYNLQAMVDDYDDMLTKDRKQIDILNKSTEILKADLREMKSNEDN